MSPHQVEMTESRREPTNRRIQLHDPMSSRSSLLGGNRQTSLTSNGTTIFDATISAAIALMFWNNANGTV